MPFCSNCGTKLEDSERFCSACGYLSERSFALSPTKDSTVEKCSAEERKTNLASNTVKGIGIALLLVGLISGIIAAVFIVSSGEAFGYDYWSYGYGGGRDMGIGIAVFSGASLLIGLCVLVGIASSIENH